MKNITKLLFSPINSVSKFSFPSPLSSSSPISENLSLSDSSPKSSPVYSHRDIGDYSKTGMNVIFLLNDEIFGKKFREFSKENHCSENVEFLDDIFLLNEKDINDSYNYILKTYLNDNAERCLNVPILLKDKLYSNYKNKNFKNIFELFSDIIKCVYDDIKQSDTLRNFLISNKETNDFLFGREMKMVVNYFTIKNIHVIFKNTRKEYHNHIKFLVGLNTSYHLHEKKQRKASVLKLISCYIIKGSQFFLELPDEYINYIVNCNITEPSELEDVKIYCFKNLKNDENLMNFIRSQTSLQF